MRHISRASTLFDKCCAEASVIRYLGISSTVRVPASGRVSPAAQLAQPSAEPLPSRGGAGPCSVKQLS